MWVTLYPSECSKLHFELKRKTEVVRVVLALGQLCVNWARAWIYQLSIDEMFSYTALLVGVIIWYKYAICHPSLIHGGLMSPYGPWSSCSLGKQLLPFSFVMCLIDICVCVYTGGKWTVSIRLPKINLAVNTQLWNSTGEGSLLIQRGNLPPVIHLIWAWLSLMCQWSEA